LLINLALYYAIWKVQVKEDCFKLNGTDQLLVHGDDINIHWAEVL